MKEEIGKRIYELRKSMNMNKRQFAKFIGISGQYLGKVELGIHGLSLDSLINLCNNTNVSADYILFGKEKISDEMFQNLFAGINQQQMFNAFKTLEKVAEFIKKSS